MSRRPLQGLDPQLSEISPLMRIAKLKQRSLWGIAIQHNLREKLPSRKHNIDPTKTPQNVVLAGDATGSLLRDLIVNRVARVIRKPRKDGVWALEAVFSLPPRHRLPDEIAYFRACTEWTSTWCGGEENIISAVVHKDESAPHLHVLILPILNSRLQGFGSRPTQRSLANRVQVRTADIQMWSEVAEAAARFVGSKSAAAASGSTAPTGASIARDLKKMLRSLRRANQGSMEGAANKAAVA